MRPSRKALLVLMVLVLALPACGGGLGSEAIPTFLAPATTEPSSGTPSPPKLGDWDEVEGYALVAYAVEDPALAKEGPHQSEAGAKLVAVQFELANVGGGRSTVLPAQMVLIDDAGREYESAPGSMAEHEEFEGVSIGPGETATGWLAFEVPEGSTPAHLHFELGWWNERTYLRVSLTE